MSEHDVSSSLPDDFEGALAALEHLVAQIALRAILGRL